MAQSPATLPSGGFAAVLFDDGLITNVDYDGSNNPIYVGKAKPGSSGASAVWQIAKMTFSGTNMTSKRFASGNLAFDKIWDNRVALTYS